MFTSYLLTFCRITIALLFIFSFGSKLLALRNFAVTIGDFKLLPRRWSKSAALFFLIGEITTVVLLTMGNGFLFVGFLLAITLLVIFSAALVIALWRKLDMSCNCFGQVERRISHYDVIRNGLFILCCLIGLWMLRSVSQETTWGAILLLTSMSAVLLMVVTNIGEVVDALRQPFPVNGERR